MQRILLLFLSFFAFSNAFAQTAQLSFDSAVVETGEAFMLHIAVTNAEPDTIDLSVWDTLLHSDNILSRSGWQKNGNQWTNDVQYITFDAAELQLPPLTVLLRDGRTVPTNEAHLTILATPVPSTDLNDMADLKNIHKEPKNWTDYLWIGWILGGLAILALLIYWVNRRKPKTTLQTRSTRLSPTELAQKKLAHLEQQQLWQKGDIKTYYAELSSIIREYLDGRFQTDSLKKGADEALQNIQKWELTPAQQQAVRTLLTNADLAKFAKGQPGEAYHGKAMEDAREIVG